MGYWENTAYVRCADLRRIVGALEGLFAEEGFRACEPPPPREPASFDCMQYGTAAENELWAVAIVPGRAPWSVVKTAPFELLIERATQASALRIAELCRRLAAAGFQYNIYDGDQTLLVEASATGQVRVSGFCEDCPGIVFDEQYSRAEYNGEPVVLGEAAFGLIDVEPDIGNALTDRWSDGALGRVLCGASGAHDNLVQVEHLIPHHPLSIPKADVAYFRKGPAAARTR